VSVKNTKFEIQMFSTSRLEYNFASVWQILRHFNSKTIQEVHIKSSRLDFWIAGFYNIRICTLTINTVVHKNCMELSMNSVTITLYILYLIPNISHPAQEKLIERFDRFDLCRLIQTLKNQDRQGISLLESIVNFIHGYSPDK